MSKIEINNVYKIFGSNPKSILPMVKDGASKEEILDKTGHTVGLDNVTLKIVRYYKEMLSYLQLSAYKYILLSI